MSNTDPTKNYNRCATGTQPKTTMDEQHGPQPKTTIDEQHEPQQKTTIDEQHGPNQKLQWMSNMDATENYNG